MIVLALVQASMQLSLSRELFAMLRRWFRPFDEHGPVDCVVYRGVGGDSISIPNCNDLSNMVDKLDSLSHWMWGIGGQFKLALLDYVVVPCDISGRSAITFHGLPGTIVSIGKILIGSARTIESLSIDPESIFVLSVEHMFQVGLF
jgi:hypothetical protein